MTEWVWMLACVCVCVLLPHVAKYFCYALSSSSECVWLAVALHHSVNAVNSFDTALTFCSSACMSDSGGYLQRRKRRSRCAMSFVSQAKIVHPCMNSVSRLLCVLCDVLHLHSQSLRYIYVYVVSVCLLENFFKIS